MQYLIFDIFDQFLKIFPEEASNVLTYRSHGKNTIAIWFRTGLPVLFTFSNEEEWILTPYY